MKSPSHPQVLQDPADNVLMTPHWDLIQIALYLLLVAGGRILIGAADGITRALKLGQYHRVS
jgi:hypothetical protein